MNTRKLRLVIGIAALAATLGAGASAFASDDQDGGHKSSCRSRIVGTYLTTILDSEGEFASRSIMSFHDDGRVTAVDSSQESGIQNAGFTAQLGSYACSGRRSARAVTLNFGFTYPPDLARTDWEFSIHRGERSIEGTAVLYILPDVEFADPFADGLQPVATFTFDGVRVPARVR